MMLYSRFSFERLEAKRSLSANQLVAIEVLPSVDDVAANVAVPSQATFTARNLDADVMPPHGLPDAKLISGMQTKSTFGLGGNDQLIVDSTNGLALVRIHGQHDMNSTIEHDEPLSDSLERDNPVAIDEAFATMPTAQQVVGVNEATTIGAAQEVTVGIMRPLTPWRTNLGGWGSSGLM